MRLYEISKILFSHKIDPSTQLLVFFFSRTDPSVKGPSPLTYFPQEGLRLYTIFSYEFMDALVS